jgi:hypothetical protein
MGPVLGNQFDEPGATLGMAAWWRRGGGVVAAPYGAATAASQAHPSMYE